MTQRRPLIVQQEKLLKLAVSDYIDRIVDGRRLRQRVITQPRPVADFVASNYSTLTANLITKKHVLQAAVGGMK